MSTYSFPHNQTLDALNIASGDSAYSFIISACSNGLGAAEIQLTTSTSPYNYTLGLPYNIDAAGASTTALAFLPGPVTPSTTIPLYLLGGTAANHLKLFSLTPTASGGSFVADNVSASTTLGDPFDMVISAILYVPSLATVYVAGENGNLYSYSVTWNGSAPTLTYEHTNNIYTYDPATGKPPTATISYNTTCGAPYSLLADANLNLLVNSGSTGLYLYSVANAGASGLPESVELIPYNVGSTGISDLKQLETVAKMAFEEYKEYEGSASPASTAPS